MSTSPSPLMSASSTLFVHDNSLDTPMVVLVASSHRSFGSIDADLSAEAWDSSSGCCVLQPTRANVIKTSSIKPNPCCGNFWYLILAAVSCSFAFICRWSAHLLEIVIAYLCLCAQGPGKSDRSW